MGTFKRISHRLLASIIIIVIIILVLLGTIQISPPQYDLNDEYLQITTDKNVYEMGDDVIITIVNMHDQPLFVSYSGCEGKVFGASKYADNEWIEFPSGCGLCQSIAVQEEFKPNEPRVFQWEQNVYTDEVDCNIRRIDDIGTGWYRIAVWRIGIGFYGTNNITSYSLPFQII